MKLRCVHFHRHWCDHNDRLKYGWTYHDGENFGVEQIIDENIQLNIQFLKEVTGDHGGDWTSRIQVNSQVSKDRSPLMTFLSSRSIVREHDNSSQLHPIELKFCTQNCLGRVRR